MTEQQEITYLTKTVKNLKRQQKNLKQHPELKGQSALCDIFWKIRNTLNDVENKFNSQDLYPVDEFDNNDDIENGDDLMDNLQEWVKNADDTFDNPTGFPRQTFYQGLAKIKDPNALYTAYAETPADVELTTPEDLAERLDDSIANLERKIHILQ